MLVHEIDSVERRRRRYRCRPSQSSRSRIEDAHEMLRRGEESAQRGVCGSHTCARYLDNVLLASVHPRRAEAHEDSRSRRGSRTGRRGRRARRGGRSHSQQSRRVRNNLRKATVIRNSTRKLTTELTCIAHRVHRVRSELRRTLDGITRVRSSATCLKDAVENQILEAEEKRVTPVPSAPAAPISDLSRRLTFDLCTHA